MKKKGFRWPEESNRDVLSDEHMRVLTDLAKETGLSKKTLILLAIEDMVHYNKLFTKHKVRLSILLPSDPAWDKFKTDLEGYLRVYRLESKIQFICDHTYKISRYLLDKLSHIDTEKTIAFFEKNKIKCDCKIYQKDWTGFYS